MVIANAVLVEEPLIVSGRRDRFVLQVDNGQHGTLLPWMGDTDRKPGFAGKRAKCLDISRQRDHATGCSSLLHFVRRPVCGVPLSNAAHIDTHPLSRKKNGADLLIDLNARPVYQWFQSLK